VEGRLGSGNHLASRQVVHSNEVRDAPKSALVGQPEHSASKWAKLQLQLQLQLLGLQI